MKPRLAALFNREWGNERHALHAAHRFDTLKSAVRTFQHRAQEQEPEGAEVADPEPRLDSGETG